MFERRKAKKQIEAKLNEIQMNLENNYKDLTLQSRKEAEALLQKFHQEGILRESDLAIYSKRLTEYSRKMEHYGHTDISSFLKDRY